MTQNQGDVDILVACHVKGDSDFVHSNSDIKTECPAEEMCVGNVLLAVLGKSRYGGMANLGGVNAPTIADLKLPMI